MSGHRLGQGIPGRGDGLRHRGADRRDERQVDREVFAADGGAKLIGTNVLDCHPEPSRSKLQGMMDERRTNVYTIQKNGKKKLIYQAPWYKDGVYAGFVELSLEIPWDMPHFNRDK